MKLRNYYGTGVPHSTHLAYPVSVTVSGREIDTAERIVEVARECFEEVGIRRTSMEDIARAAGVGRTTVFRRFESKDQIVQMVMLRIIAQIADDVRTRFLKESDLEVAVTEAMVVWVRQFLENPLFAKVMRTEPEVFTGTLTRDGSSVIAIVRASVTEWLGKTGGGPLSDPDAEATAEILTRLGITLILAPGGVIPVGDDRALRKFLRRYVAPGVALLARN